MLHQFRIYSLLDLIVKISSEPVYKESDQSLEITKQQDLRDKIILQFVNTRFVQKLTIKGDEIYSLDRLDVFEQIPNFEINAKSITNIPNYCFSNLSNLKKVTLGTNVHEIGYYSFANSSLTSINAERIETIGSYAFYKCYMLESIDLSHAYRIEDYAFSESSITEINIPQFGYLTFAFYNCSKLNMIDNSRHAFESMGDQLDFTSITSLTLDYCHSNFL